MKTNSSRLRRPSQTEVYRRSLDALKLMREHRASLAAAAREVGTTPKSVKKYGTGALYQRRGRYRARDSDRLRRELYLYDSRGKFSVDTHSSKTASLIGKYHNAVRSFVAYGDPQPLEELTGKTVTIGGKKIAFLTDLKTLGRLARAGELDILDIYSMGKAS